MVVAVEVEVEVEEEALLRRTMKRWGSGEVNHCGPLRRLLL
jgi:hypothetical protein